MNPNGSYPSHRLLLHYPPTNVNGIPDYIDPRLDHGSHQMILRIIYFIPHYGKIELCPRFTSNLDMYYHLTVDPMWIDVDVRCSRCSPERQYTHLTERERNWLSARFPEYKARMESRVDFSQIPTPPPPPPPPPPQALPPRGPPPLYTPHVSSQMRLTPAAARNLSQPSDPGPSRVPRARARPQPYNSRRFLSSGSRSDPIDLEAHQRDYSKGKGTSADPLDLTSE
ncbi:hypothetical protein VKT23_019229 [Stygiomarasmius scandens]|uniref:Uncharacterized protein n=1 Tax=Marasmiellus scandens TaxID=2682957 RepID=A0ABR1IPZ1_9AGAR